MASEGAQAEPGSQEEAAPDAPAAEQQEEAVSAAQAEAEAEAGCWPPGEAEAEAGGQPAAAAAWEEGGAAEGGYQGWGEQTGWEGDRQWGEADRAATEDLDPASAEAVAATADEVGWPTAQEGDPGATWHAEEWKPEEAWKEEDWKGEQWDKEGWGEEQGSGASAPGAAQAASPGEASAAPAAADSEAGPPSVPLPAAAVSEDLAALCQLLEGDGVPVMSPEDAAAAAAEAVAEAASVVAGSAAAAEAEAEGEHGAGAAEAEGPGASAAPAAVDEGGDMVAAPAQEAVAQVAEEGGEDAQQGWTENDAKFGEDHLPKQQEAGAATQQAGGVPASDAAAPGEPPAAEHVDALQVPVPASPPSEEEELLVGLGEADAAVGAGDRWPPAAVPESAAGTAWEAPVAPPTMPASASQVRLPPGLELQGPSNCGAQEAFADSGGAQPSSSKGAGSEAMAHATSSRNAREEAEAARWAVEGEVVEVEVTQAEVEALTAAPRIVSKETNEQIWPLGQRITAITGARLDVVPWSAESAGPRLRVSSSCARQTRRALKYFRLASSASMGWTRVTDADDDEDLTFMDVPENMLTTITGKQGDFLPRTGHDTGAFCFMVAEEGSLSGYGTRPPLEVARPTASWLECGRTIEAKKAGDIRTESWVQGLVLENIRNVSARVRFEAPVQTERVVDIGTMRPVYVEGEEVDVQTDQLWIKAVVQERLPNGRYRVQVVRDGSLQEAGWQALRPRAPGTEDEMDGEEAEAASAPPVPEPPRRGPRLAIFGPPQGRCAAQWYLLKVLERNLYTGYAVEHAPSCSWGTWRATAHNVGRDALGKLIGKKGAMRRKLVQASGCNIEFSETHDSAFALVGGPDWERGVACAIMDTLVSSDRGGDVQAIPAAALDCKDDVFVPAGLVRGLIGQGHLKRIEEEEHVFIFIQSQEWGGDAEATGGEQERVLYVLAASPRARQTAKLRLMSAVDSFPEAEGHFANKYSPHISDAEELDMDFVAVQEVQRQWFESVRERIEVASGCSLAALGPLALLLGTGAERKRGREYLAWALDCSGYRPALRLPISKRDLHNRTDVLVLEVAAEDQPLLTMEGLQELMVATRTLAFVREPPLEEMLQPGVQVQVVRGGQHFAFTVVDASEDGAFEMRLRVCSPDEISSAQEAAELLLFGMQGDVDGVPVAAIAQRRLAEILQAARESARAWQGAGGAEPEAPWQANPESAAAPAAAWEPESSWPAAGAKDHSWEKAQDKAWQEDRTWAGGKEEDHQRKDEGSSWSREPRGDAGTKAWQDDGAWRSAGRDAEAQAPAAASGWDREATAPGHTGMARGSKQGAAPWGNGDAKASAPVGAPPGAWESKKASAPDGHGGAADDAWAAWQKGKSATSAREAVTATPAATGGSWDAWAAGGAATNGANKDRSSDAWDANTLRVDRGSAGRHDQAAERGHWAADGQWGRR